MHVHRRQQKLTKGKECHIQIHTAFVDNHDEFITVLVKATKHPYEHWVILTDDGYIINDLCKSGIKLDSLGGKKLLENILSNFGVVRAEYPTRTDRKSFVPTKVIFIRGCTN
ncbi:hypothetical protein AGMMS49573_07120 [Endomicrobiia bacterium]|nr:hypothetical protein AGMMS49573_07120 [Endomicrobiia bacterium]